MPEFLLSLFLGIGLSAACGFRIFVPLLILSLATLSGHMSLSGEFGWIATYPALMVFAVATILEIVAYLIPWVDNLLDTVTTPLAIIAGTAVTASVITEIDPLLKWSLAIIAGGGVAGTIQTFTGLSRITSTTFTGGLGNPVLSTAEATTSLGMSLISISFPVVAFALVILLLIFCGKKIRSKLLTRKIRTQEE